MLVLRWLRLSAVGWLVVAGSGCALWREPPANRYETIKAPPRRDTALAREKNCKALALIAKDDLSHAEAYLQDALIADVTFGPAHNNLGELYFRCNKLYLAAWEFEYAARLMPHRPEPLNNLGMVLEAASRFDEAIGNYEAAHALAPADPEYLANLTRALIRRGDRTPDVAALLRELEFNAPREDWRLWAREQLATTFQDLDWSVGVPMEFLPEEPTTIPLRIEPNPEASDGGTAIGGPESYPPPTLLPVPSSSLGSRLVVPLELTHPAASSSHPVPTEWRSASFPVR